MYFVAAVVLYITSRAAVTRGTRQMSSYARPTGPNGVLHFFFNLQRLFIYSLSFPRVGLTGAGMGFVFGIFLGAMGDMQPMQMINGREVPQAPLGEQVPLLYTLLWPRVVFTPPTLASKKPNAHAHRGVVCLPQTTKALGSVRLKLNSRTAVECTCNLQMIGTVCERDVQSYIL